MPDLSTGYVFMSYSRRDDEVMRRIVTYLRNQGIKVWVDNEKLIPGTPIWEEAIEKAIKNAPAIVVVLSPESKNSEWVRREISLADQYRKRVFPVMVRGDEESSITLRLINRQFVDIRKNEGTGLSSLATAITVYLQELSSQEQQAKIEIQKLALTQSAEELISHGDLKESAPYTFANAPLLAKRVLTGIKGLQVLADLQSLLQSSNVVGGAKPSKFRVFLIFIFWLWCFLTVSPLIISLILGIRNVVLIFLFSVIAFGAIGVRRGWAKEALLLFSIILGIASNYFLSKYIPLVRDLDPTSVSRFWIETTIIELLVYFSYQISLRIPCILSKASQERFKDKRFGIIFGVINGYMIAGTLLYYNHLAEYPFWNAPVITDSVLWQSINRMMFYMPPHVLGEPTIYGALILSFILTLIVLV